jgi:REP element-mobilizing transposase RayT
MPDHWHLMVWPQEDGALSQFVGWLTLTHTQRWHAHRARPVRGMSTRVDSSHFLFRMTSIFTLHAVLHLVLRPGLTGL